MATTKGWPKEVLAAWTADHERLAQVQADYGDKAGVRGRDYIPSLHFVTNELAVPTGDFRRYFSDRVSKRKKKKSPKPVVFSFELKRKFKPNKHIDLLFAFANDLPPSTDTMPATTRRSAKTTPASSYDGSVDESFVNEDGELFDEDGASDDEEEQLARALTKKATISKALTKKATSPLRRTSTRTKYALAADELAKMGAIKLRGGDSKSFPGLSVSCTSGRKHDDGEKTVRGITLKQFYPSPQDEPYVRTWYAFPFICIDYSPSSISIVSTTAVQIGVPQLRRHHNQG